MNPNPTIALLGCPNAGKTALFNALTKSNLKVGNYPGVTVESKEGLIEFNDTLKAKLVDLPGIYSLKPLSLDEEVTVNFLKNKEKRPQLILAVVDATNLERHLGLLLELKALHIPMVVALNMFDLAEQRGLELDINHLSELMGSPIIPTVAIKSSSIVELMQAMESSLDTNLHLCPDEEEMNIAPSNILDRQNKVTEILDQVTLKKKERDSFTEKLDSIILNRVFGPFLLVFVLLGLFQSVFSLASWPMDWIEMGIAAIANGIETYLPDNWVKSLILDGMIAGVGSVLVFLPQIIILTFFIIIMEGSGYMMRVAFLLDRLMSWVGLQGRSFVPLLSSYACAIPGIMSARTIKDPRDRLLTMMVAPLMTCSARMPVYVLLIGAFIPSETIFGPLGYQGLAMFFLFFAGIVSAMIYAWVMKKTLLKSSKAPFIHELPTYKFPTPNYVFKQLSQKAKAFLRKAGTLIMGISVVLWLLSSYPEMPEGHEGSQITYSVAGRMGMALEPIFEPLGFDWRITTGLIPGFAAREVMVGALGTVFAVEDAEEGGFKNLQSSIKETWSIASGLSLLVWYIFAPQCLATFAVAKKEMGGWKWPVFMFLFFLFSAYFFSYITYQVTSAITA